MPRKSVASTPTVKEFNARKRDTVRQCNARRERYSETMQCERKRGT